MKMVFSSPDGARVAPVRSRLDAAEVGYEVRNDAVSQALAGAPFIAEIWVLHDADYEEARRLVLPEK